MDGSAVGVLAEIKGGKKRAMRISAVRAFEKYFIEKVYHSADSIFKRSINSIYYGD